MGNTLCECGRPIEMDEITEMFVHLDNKDMFCDESYEKVATPVPQATCPDGFDDRKFFRIYCDLPNGHSGSHHGVYAGLDMEWDEIKR